ncbi:hypothetical protein Tco_0210941 [Tanacetum coccineum]
MQIDKTISIEEILQSKQRKHFNQGQIYRLAVNQTGSTSRDLAPHTPRCVKTDLKICHGQYAIVEKHAKPRTLSVTTVTNPKEDLKGITTRSCGHHQAPKAVGHDTEVTNDTMPPANNEAPNTSNLLLFQNHLVIANPEPNVTLLEIPILKASIPIPSRRNETCARKKLTNKLEFK